MIRWVRGWARTRFRRVLLAALLAVIVVGTGYSVWDSFRARVYYVSGLSFKYYKSAKVPPEIVAKLAPLEGKEFVQKREMVDALHGAVGDKDFQTYQSTLVKRIRTRSCWPNESAQKVHAITDSRGHPLYNRFGIELLIGQRELPPVATQLEFLPNGEGVLVLGKYGHLTWFGPDWRAKVTLQIPGVFEGGEDEGALGLAIDPQFAQNRMLYVGFVDTKGTHNRIERLTLSTDPAAVLKSRVPILNMPKDRTENVHGMGSLRFDREGFMLAQVGDPGDANETFFDYEGKVLRLRPGTGPGGGYTATRLNWVDRVQEFLQRQSTLAVARGLRSPFTGTLFRDRLVIGDVGSSGPHSHEEVNVSALRLEDFGWPECQNPQLHAAYTPPIISYRRNDPGVIADDPLAVDGAGRAVIVGVVYDGASTDRYQGTLDRRLLYGDFYLGFLRGARLSDKFEVEDDVFLTHLPSMSSMRIGPDGYIYGVTAFGDKGLFRLILKNPLKNPPRK